MDQSNKDMVFFCLEFVKNNVYEQSQNVQCRIWIKNAVEIIEKSSLENADFLVLNLHAVDAFFSGHDSSSTTNNIIDKVKLIEALLKDV